MSSAWLTAMPACVIPLKRSVSPKGSCSATKPDVKDCVNMPRPSWVPIITNCEAREMRGMRDEWMRGRGWDTQTPA